MIVSMRQALSFPPFPCTNFPSHFSLWIQLWSIRHVYSIYQYFLKEWMNEWTNDSTVLQAILLYFLRKNSHHAWHTIHIKIIPNFESLHKYANQPLARDILYTDYNWKITVNIFLRDTTRWRYWLLSVILMKNNPH